MVPLEFIAANCINEETGRDEGRCMNKAHLHSPIYCMAHGQTPDEHVVGGMCIDDDCGKQWFFNADWSVPECRAMLSHWKP